MQLDSSQYNLNLKYTRVFYLVEIVNLIFYFSIKGKLKSSRNVFDLFWINLNFRYHKCYERTYLEASHSNKIQLKS